MMVNIPHLALICKEMTSSESKIWFEYRNDFFCWFRPPHEKSIREEQMEIAPESIDGF